MVRQIYIQGQRLLLKPISALCLCIKGKITDVLMEGTHQVKTENFPILTRLANWRFGFESPLRCEVWFFSSTVYANRRWGIIQPVIYDFPGYQAVPIRAYGIFNIVVRDPRKVFMTLIGNRISYDISELEGFVQAQVTELLPQALSVVPRLRPNFIRAKACLAAVYKSLELNDHATRLLNECAAKTSDASLKVFFKNLVKSEVK